MSEPVVIYTSKFCLHSRIVERFFKTNHVPMQMINIDGDLHARQELMAMNRGYASVPTLLFPDGTQLTEPSLGEIKAKLGIKDPGLVERFKGLFGR
ncbi:MAG: glutaredoxin family protein [Candidatus Promineifilaceae bacterium]|nr:glutaredoxin family protein [Candidatus Promineifilaceae bacterium]